MGIAPGFFRSRPLLSAIGAAVLAVAAGPAFAGTVLITADEGKLPPPKGGFAMGGRGITRGPRIEIADIDKGALHPPVHLQFKFQAFGGATIDLTGLQVTYMRSPSIDLTSRIRPFAQVTGIDIPDAELPPGDHIMRIELRDSDGRTSAASFVLVVAP